MQKENAKRYGHNWIDCLRDDVLANAWLPNGPGGKVIAERKGEAGVERFRLAVSAGWHRQAETI